MNTTEILDLETLTFAAGPNMQVLYLKRLFGDDQRDDDCPPDHDGPRDGRGGDDLPDPGGSGDGPPRDVFSASVRSARA